MKQHHPLRQCTDNSTGCNAVLRARPNETSNHKPATGKCSGNDIAGEVLWAIERVSAWAFGDISPPGYLEDLAQAPVSTDPNS